MVCNSSWNSCVRFRDDNAACFAYADGTSTMRTTTTGMILTDANDDDDDEDDADDAENAWCLMRIG